MFKYYEQIFNEIYIWTFSVHSQKLVFSMYGTWGANCVFPLLIVLTNWGSNIQILAFQLNA